MVGESGLTKPTRNPASAVGRLGDPGRAGEELEPEARQQVGELPPAPPVVNDRDQLAVVGLDRAPEPQGRGARIHAATPSGLAPELAPCRSGVRRVEEEVERGLRHER